VEHKRTQIALGLAAAVLLLDQLTKWLVVAVVMQPPRVVEVTGFFNLVLTHNTGISLGMWSGASAWKPWVLSGLALAIVAGLLVWDRQRDRPVACARGDRLSRLPRLRLALVGFQRGG
jgi:signal peptidase II